MKTELTDPFLKIKINQVTKILIAFPIEQFHTFLEIDHLPIIIAEYILDTKDRILNYDNKHDLIVKSIYEDKKNIKAFLKKNPPFDSIEYPEAKTLQIIMGKNSIKLSSIDTPLLAKQILRVLESYSDNFFRPLPDLDKKNPKKVNTKIFETAVIGLYSLLFLNGLHKHLEPINDRKVGLIRDVFDCFGIDYKVTYYRKIIKNSHLLHS